MPDIRSIDPNMDICRLPEDPSCVWRDCREMPFRIYGLYRPELPGKFRRLPEDVAAATNEGVAALSRHTAGGRLRFMTDSPYIAIRARIADAFAARMDHITDCATLGFDLYKEKDGRDIYFGTFRIPHEARTGYESKLALPEGLHAYTINFPLYDIVDALEIGLKAGARLEARADYPDALPIVFYGSSITQGGCASRPGNAYTSIIGRMLNRDHINLGFSGSGCGEVAIAEYIASLPMRVFVCDYDHNAPTPEHLANTHERLYKIFRAKQPDTPIVFVTRPDTDRDPEDAEKRRKVIRATYDHAVAAGDTRVRYIDGSTLFDGPMRDACTVDTCHPNDIGMLRMAQTIGAAISTLI